MIGKKLNYSKNLNFYFTELEKQVNFQLIRLHIVINYMLKCKNNNEVMMLLKISISNAKIFLKKLNNKFI